jgi:hypothetical protein
VAPSSGMGRLAAYTGDGLEGHSDNLCRNQTFHSVVFLYGIIVRHTCDPGSVCSLAGEELTSHENL